MKSVVIIPGPAPHWVGDHARHLAQRLTDSGRVMVVFTHATDHHAMMPGRPGNGSVLGHSVAGYPIWTGRLAAALGVRRSSAVTVILLWPGASRPLALWAAIASRCRRESIVLDIPEIAPSRGTTPRTKLFDRTLRKLAVEVVEGTAPPVDEPATRVILALCGSDFGFAHLMMQTFESMSDSAASRWNLLLQIDACEADVAYGGSRRVGKVTTLVAEPSVDVLRMSDVLVADFDGRFEDLVRQAVLSGGAGVLVGQPVAERIARCHDGVWLAQRNSASILVALEASSGDMFERPGSVAEMRRLANEVVQIAEREIAA